MNNKEYNYLGKIIAHALRHEPETYDLIVDDNGFTDINDLIKGINKFSKYDLDYEKLVFIVNTDTKQRYEIFENKIRARYGHSFEKKIEYQKETPPDFLYHGTSRSAFTIISLDGLKPMERQYVHLSSSKEIALSVGKRHDQKPILLTIDSKKAHESGINFYKTTGNTWLVEYMPPQFIVEIESDEETTNETKN